MIFRAPPQTRRRFDSVSSKLVGSRNFSMTARAFVAVA
jgi:hypothetical protein